MEPKVYPWTSLAKIFVSLQPSFLVIKLKGKAMYKNLNIRRQTT